MGPAIVRVTVSVGPPAANGTTIVMGPVGCHALREALAGALSEGDPAGDPVAASDGDAAGLEPACVHAAASRSTAAIAARRAGRGRNEST
jgi:hypothetical protein